MSLRRRRLAIPLILSVLAAQAMGCAAPEPPVTAPTSEVAALQPQKGGTFYLAVRSKPSHLFPFSDDSTANSITTGPVYETC